MSNYFPEDILQEIFVRLPGRSLLRFRCVSKSFCTLIDTPSSHIMHHDLSIINTSIMFCDTVRKKICTIDYKSVLSLLPLSSPSTIIKCELINQMNYPSMFQDCRVDFFSSCNGLVWLSLTTSSWGEEFYIWNPLTEVYKNIPMPREINVDDICGNGFCYDCKTNDYKLVRVVIDWDSECSEIDVYTLSSNSWRNTKRIPYYLYDGKYSGTLFNGALHWFARDFEKDSNTMVCFNVVNETFQEVAVPKLPMPYPEEPLEDDMFDIYVEVLGGCLSLFFHVFDVNIDVWMMQEYGVRDSWMKSFSITHENITSSNYLEFIWSFKNNEILWEVDGVLVLYDPKTKIYSELTSDSHCGEFQFNLRKDDKYLCESFTSI